MAGGVMPAFAPGTPPAFAQVNGIELCSSDVLA
jgi:hypothetical protein